MGFPGLSAKREVTNEQRAMERQELMQEKQIAMESGANPNESLFDAQQLEARADLMRWQQDLSDEYEKLKHRLRSEVQDNKGNWIQQYAEEFIRDPEGNILYDPITRQPKKERKIVSPLCNESFIREMDGLVAPFLSRNQLNTNFNEKLILRTLRNTLDCVSDLLAEGFDKFGISFYHFDVIERMITNIIQPSLYRSLNDGERRHQRSISKRIEAFSETARAHKPMGRISRIFDSEPR